MDLRIKITDENSDTLQEIVVYQDGSDAEGAERIAKFLRETFTIDSDAVADGTIRHEDDDQDEAEVRCQGCDWTGTEDQVALQGAMIPDLWQRVEPGEVMPFGECPECGALVHQIAQEERSTGT